MASDQESHVRASVEEFLRTRRAYVRLRYVASEHRRLDLTGLKCILRGFFDRGCLQKNFSRSKDFNILNRLIYRLSGPYRRHRFFQYLRAINKKRNKIDQLNCYETLCNLAEGITVERDDSCHFPSKDYFGYALATMVAVVVLACEIVSACEKCAPFCLAVMEEHHLVHVLSVVLGVTAGIRSAAVELVHNAMSVYEQLVRWYSKPLKQCSTSPLPELPPSLHLPTVDAVLKQRQKFVAAPKSQMQYFTFLKTALEENDDFARAAHLNLTNASLLAETSTTAMDADLLAEEPAAVSHISFVQALKAVKSLASLSRFYDHLRSEMKCESQSDGRRSAFRAAVKLIKAGWKQIKATKKTNRKEAAKQLRALKVQLSSLF